MHRGGFAELDAGALGATRDALHAYSRVMGAWLKLLRPRRKHWWHSSLRPSLKGLTTGVIRSDVDFEVELDLLASRLHARTSDDESSVELAGQPPASVAAWLDEALYDIGVRSDLTPGDELRSATGFPGYLPRVSVSLQQALASVTAELERFRNGIREEASPLQFWPHHFDLSMIWLPGNKIPGQDPADEEYADKQMNFGFAFGDAGIAEPYFYITVYPLPDALPETVLPAGTTWQSDGFSGAVLLYRDLVATGDPSAYLQDLWSTLLRAGRAHLANDN